MALPVTITVSGGLPVQQSTTGYGLPLEISTLPGALPITIVISGGVPCLDPLGSVFGGGGGDGAFWFDDADNSALIALLEDI